MAKRTKKDVTDSQQSIIKESEDNLAVAAEALVAMDSVRATQLETFGLQYNLLPQLKGEIDALRHANRYVDRLNQLSSKV